MAQNIFLIAIIAVSIALVTVILLQQRGSGLGSAFGGGGGESYYQKRGMEKLLFYATITLSIIFIGLTIANLLFGA